MSEQTGVAAPATAADVMRPPLTTVEQQGHVAAAAYLMKHAGTTALIVLNALTDQPIGIITEANIAHAVADGKDMNGVRIHVLCRALLEPEIFRRARDRGGASHVKGSTNGRRA